MAQNSGVVSDLAQAFYLALDKSQEVFSAYLIGRATEQQAIDANQTAQAALDAWQAAETEWINLTNLERKLT